MTHKEWSDNAVKNINRVSAALRGIPIIGQTSHSQGGTPESPVAANGAAIAQALADYMKTNNSTTQALAIRIVDLAARYHQRAA